MALVQAALKTFIGAAIHNITATRENQISADIMEETEDLQNTFKQIQENENDQNNQSKKATQSGMSGGTGPKNPQGGAPGGINIKP